MTSLDDLAFTIPSLRKAYASGTTPAEVIAEVFRRLRIVDDPAIFLHLADEDALIEQANALGAYDPTQPLWGVPFAAKDNIDVAGMPTTAGCPAYKYEPKTDAFVVARLKEAGALVLGKTNLDQFATGLVGVRSPYGVPKNALDPTIVPGGSSSGSAVVVAHGIVPFALGTDTAGSGRVPAALNNIVGLKPSLGALSARGVVPACRTLDTISVFALTVEDAHAVFTAASGYDHEDAYSRKLPLEPMPASLPAPQICAPDARSLIFFGDETHSEDFEATLDSFREHGAQISRVDFTPFYEVAELLYEGAWVAERYAAIEHMMTAHPHEVHPVTRGIIGQAEALSAADAFKGLYRLEELKRACEPLIDAADMLCVPSIPTFYSRDALKADPIKPNSNLGTYTNFVNLLNLCAIAVPTGPRGDGRPGSVTLIAMAGQDGKVAAHAAKLARTHGPNLGATQHPYPSASPDRLGDVPLATDELPLAVCGAHMSGLPLNKELVSRGARLIGAARTMPDYRLYALAGGPPFRPGLVRDHNGGGMAIDVEVWSLPREAVGSFMAGIPSPLAIGTVDIEDGRSVKGFVCEEAGLDGAEDITSFGGWRNFLNSQQVRALG
ncbi:MAG: allophanate hydrolase [Pseudomonadota bacterium]